MTHQTPQIQGELAFWMHPPEGTPYPVDLTEFAVGRTKADVRASLQDRWPGDFTGRLGFACALADVFRATCPSKAMATRIASACRQLLRFLDEIDPDAVIQSFDDLCDNHGVELKAWLQRRGLSPSLYKYHKGLVDIARLTSGARPLFWPARDRDQPVHKDDIDVAGFQRLYTAFKKEAMSIKRMFRDGHALADRGRDPRGVRGRPGTAGWECVENHAWLVRELTKDTLPDKRGFYSAGAGGLNKANDAATQKHDGPDYLAPGMTARGRQGLVGKLRWFYPSYQDTAVFCWLFLLGTGWNLATTTAGTDISKEKNWCEVHPLDASFRILHGFKGRSGKHVLVPCLAQPEWHPYQIVQFMIKVTAPLRRTVLRRLHEARLRLDTDGSPESMATVAKLEMMARSPWLYHVVNKAGEIGCLTSEDSSHLNNICRLVADKYELIAEHPSLAHIVTGEARDAWIGHAYITSGNNLLIAQLAAQHADARSLVHYLRRRRYRAQSEREVRRLQDLVFGDIEEGRIMDPTRIRMALQQGKITPDQEKRLLDHRQRTRLGMGCLNPASPPRNIAPDHVTGCLCRIQRCTGCHNGIVFPDSLDPLARARAELIVVKRTIPLAAWSGSSFQEEAESLDVTLAEFDPSEVEAAIKKWLDLFLTGQLTIHDTYPMY